MGQKTNLLRYFFHAVCYIISHILPSTISSPPCICCECNQENLLVPPGYNKYQTPYEEENKPTEVYISLDIMDIDEILEDKMEFSLQLYINEYWKDERLNMTFFENYSIYRIPRDWVKDLWTPDIIFENAKKGRLYHLSIPNVVVQIHPLHYLRRYTRYGIRVSCAMYLQSYPLDTQNCLFKLMSLGYNTMKMRLKWLHERKDGGENAEDLTLARVRPLKYYVENITAEKRDVQFPGGIYNTLYANFTFVRYLSSHIVNVYIPSSLVVVIAFITFWLDVRSVPARVALGLTSLLTLSTQASQARSNLPTINYLTALDVWLFTCMMLVFLSLLEYAAAYHMHCKKVQENKLSVARNLGEGWAEKRSRTVSSTLANTEDHGAIRKRQSSSLKDVTTPLEFEDNSVYLDKISRLLFPLSFTIFLILYWIIYLGYIV